jgi:DNA-binding NarL/FixJ family response regulator
MPAERPESVDLPPVAVEAATPLGRYFQVKASSKSNAAVADPIERSLLVISAGSAIARRITTAFADGGLSVLRTVENTEEIEEGDVDGSTIIVFVCNVDLAREMAALRRLRRELRKPSIAVISPPATGTGVRRALDAGADAVVFEPEIETTLAITVMAVASGQSVVPRKLRASVERPAFSHRERQVLALVSKGLTNGEIAERLLLAQSTVKSHLSSAFTKLGIRSRKEVTALMLDPEQAQSVGLVGLNGAMTDGNGNGSARVDSLPRSIA